MIMSIIKELQNFMVVDQLPKSGNQCHATNETNIRVLFSRVSVYLNLGKYFEHKSFQFIASNSQFINHKSSECHCDNGF